MTGESMPPEPPAEGAWPTGAQDSIAAEGGVPPSPPGTPPDPAAVTGPPWPRLVAADGTYTAPRLIRWPIVVGVLLLAGWIAAVGAAVASSPTSGYGLTASDAHFTATFPVRPRRTVRIGGRVIIYGADLRTHTVGVTFISLPALASGSPASAIINGTAASLPGGKVVSRHSLTYRGQAAEDAVITFSAGTGHLRVVKFGLSAYVLEAFGRTASSFAHDYSVLLDTFTHS